MSKEILFRGLDKNATFQYGFYDKNSYHPDVYIEFNECTYHVIPETVGQFIGLLDCNNKKIFEGDILKYNDHEIGGKPGIGYVEWWDDLTLVLAPGWYVWCIGGGLLNRGFPFQREIIGNIHQNKELLK